MDKRIVLYQQGEERHWMAELELRVNYLLTASLALSAVLFTASLVPSFTS